jgi:16S rRNA (cytosine1402-N4)-methyltransferase
MLETVLRFWKRDDAGIYVDATYGRGGHSAALLERLGPQARLYLLDRDPDAVAHARTRFAEDARVVVDAGPFSRLGERADAWAVAGRVSGVLIDLGVSSPQLETPERGFSFLHDGPLDMRMDPTSGPSLDEWLAGVDERRLGEVLERYGEERHARRIARAVLSARRRGRLRTTGELAAVVAAAVPAPRTRLHPATRTFQALRIVVNGELDELAAVLPEAARILALSGRLLVLSFHSLEDRIVKNFFRSPRRGEPTRAGLLPLASLAPDPAERRRNPRARSARLRVAEKRREACP